MYLYLSDKQLLKIVFIIFFSLNIGSNTTKYIAFLGWGEYLVVVVKYDGNNEFLKRLEVYAAVLVMKKPRDFSLCVCVLSLTL